MNPASAASAVDTTTGMSGLGIAGLVVLSVLVVILALALIQAKFPNSKTGQAVGKVEQTIHVDATKAVEDIRNAAKELEPTILKTEIGIDNELNSLLGKVELKLTDTSGEDAAIAVAQQYLARVTGEVNDKIKAANDAKQAKLVALQQHVATLTAAASGVTNIPAGVTGTDAVVNAGPAA